MPAAARKAADAAPAVEAEKPESAPAEAAGSQAPVAEEETPEAESAEQDEPRPPVEVRFNGQAQSSVAGIGLLESGETYTVPAAVADELCGGGATLFTRVENV